MANIFISYAREDRSRVAPFVELLEQQGWTVWWDRELSPGQHFERIIDDEILEAQCVVVFWSQHSVGSEWVLAEAHDGLDRGILIPVLLDEVRVPLVFRQKQSAFLIDWPDQIDKPELERVISAIAEVLSLPSGEIDLKEITPGRKRRRSLWSALAIFTLVIFSYVFFSVKKPGENHSDASGYGQAIDQILDEVETELPEISLAIIPFKTDDKAWEALSYEVHDLLEGINDLYLSPEEHSASYGSDSDNVKIDSRYLVQGEIVQEASRPVVRIKLFDQLRNKTIWEQQFDSEGASPEESARQVARSIALELNRELPDKAELPPETYLKFLRAKAALAQPIATQEVADTRDLYAEVVAEAPRFVEARAGLCESYLYLYKKNKDPTDFEQAEKNCYRAQTLAGESENVALLNALGKMYATAGEFEQADRKFAEALKVAPYSTDIMRSRAQSYMKQGESDKAEELLLTATALEPNYWANYQVLGGLYFGKGDYEKAAVFFGRQSELVLQKASALANVGAAYYLLEAFDLAIDSWSQSLREDPTPATQANLGSAFFFNHQYHKAIEAFDAAIQMTPSDHVLWGNLGEARLYAGEEYESIFQQAADLAESEISINPNDFEALSALATYQAALGQEDTALKNLDKALSLAEDDIYTAYDVARVYARLGDRDRLQSSLERLVVMGYSESLINRDANFK